MDANAVLKVDRNALATTIREAVEEHQLSHGDEHGETIHLVDAISPLGDPDIGRGRIECEILADAIVDAIEPIISAIESAARGGGEAVAWMTDDGRVISATQKASAERDGGASRSSVAPYSIPLYATPPAPAVPTGWRIQCWAGVVLLIQPNPPPLGAAVYHDFGHGYGQEVAAKFLRALSAAQTPEIRPPGRDWAEDFSHDNGQYSHRCTDCGGHFWGHKRRVVCRACAKPAAPTPEAQR